MATLPEQVLFGRRVRLTISVPVVGTYGDAKTEQIITVGGPDEALGLRVAFRVSKQLSPMPQASEITVYNLSETTRRLLQAKGVRVLLEAGYAGTGITTYFVGDAQSVDHVREHADWRTIFHVLDGGRSFGHARMAMSFAPGTTAGTVVRAVATATGLALGNLGAAATRLDATTFQQGYAISGSAAAAMRRLLGSLGWEYSVQGGALQLLGPGIPAVNDTIPLLTPTTGLLGSPEVGTPSLMGRPATYRVKALLTPLKPGGVFHVKSDRYDTDMAVLKVNFTGDTHAGPWETDIYAQMGDHATLIGGR